MRNAAAKPRRRTVLHARNARPKAFTMVELLVCIATIALLMAMVLPAIQNARESARRAECANRLKQFGIAMHGFEAANQRFPSPALFPNLTANSSTSGMSQQKLCSAHYYLLPYLDRADLWNAIVLNGDVWAGSLFGPPTSSKNSEIIQRPVPIFACPSDNVPPGSTSYEFCDGTTAGGGTTPQIPPPNSSLHGFTRSRIGVRASEVRDGLANTVMFSERLIGGHDPKSYNPARDIAMFQMNAQAWILPDETADACSRMPPGVPFSAHAGAGWLFFGYGTTAYNHVLTPNSRIPDCAQGSLLSPGAFTARSLHPGGVSVCMGDGAVRFVSEQIDLSVWRAASTIAGDEVLTLP
jgi:type II secretory pathway pseudopilin PulG